MKKPEGFDRIAGLDLSTKSGVVIGCENEVLTKVEVTSTLKGIYRADEIAENIYLLCLKHGVSLAVIEGYAYGNKYTLAPLVEIGTLVRYKLMKANISIVLVAPASLKKFISGLGSCKKDQMRLQVYKRWAFEHPSDNVIDAYSLYQVGCALRGYPDRVNDMTKAQIDVIETVKNSKATI